MMPHLSTHAWSLVCIAAVFVVVYIIADISKRKRDREENRLK
jgi:uncharacterized membrane protein YuzA (DUF378 family)